MTRRLDIWSRVDRSRGPGACWLWTGNRRPDGYGVAYNGRNNTLAHRVVFADVRGPIPAGLELDHLCRNRRCVNPAHLEPVTHAENVSRSDVATKEACSKGHPYDAANTRYVADRSRRNPYRVCRACHSARLRARKLLATG